MGVTTSLFGLSPMFLATMGTAFFPDARDGLDAPRYLLFLAVFCGGANLLGSYGLRPVPKLAALPPIDDREALNTGDSGQVEESRPLLTRTLSPPPIEYETLRQLLGDTEFWILAFVMLIIMGMVRMSLSSLCCFH